MSAIVNGWSFLKNVADVPIIRFLLWRRMMRYNNYRILAVAFKHKQNQIEV